MKLLYFQRVLCDDNADCQNENVPFAIVFSQGDNTVNDDNEVFDVSIWYCPGANAQLIDNVDIRNGFDNVMSIFVVVLKL